MKMFGQGATEYLVLLAVVLIVALVSVALLGFFPGMASDSQLAQSQAYWQSAQPISILEVVPRTYINKLTYFYRLQLRNSGAYPIRITGLIGGDGTRITQFWGSNCGASGMMNISDFFYMAPGEEKYFGYSPCRKDIYIRTGGGGDYGVGGASTVCRHSAESPGTLDFPSFGFEYIAYMDNGQQITKRQIGKDLVVKCGPPA